MACRFTKSVASLLVAATVQVSSILPARAQGNCTSIRFPAGQSSATVNGTVGSDEPFPCYTLATGAGQTATLTFGRTNGNMAFTIDGLIDDRDSYAFKTQAKTYRFIVFQTLRANPAPFSLTVSVR